MDIAKKSDEILVYEHFAEELVFKYNTNKEADKSTYRKFEGIWGEAKSLMHNI